MAENDVIDQKETPIDQLPMAEYKKAREAAPVEKAEEVPKTEQASEAKPEGEKKSKGGFQARIDRLIKQQALTEERAAAAEKRAAELEAKVNGKEVPKTEQKTDGEPKRESFTSDAEYNRALMRWEVRQEMKAEKEAEERANAEAAEKQSAAEYNKRAIEAQSRYEDWKEVMAQDLTLPKIVGDAIIHTIKNGPDVAYFLGKNPEICEEMLTVHPLEAVAMAVKISERLEKENGGESEETEENEEEAPAKAAAEEPKPKAKAPAPIKPVTGGSSRSTIPLDKTSFADYKKLRAQGRVQ